MPAGSIDEKPVTYSVWDLKRLARYVEQGLTRQSSEVDFVKDFGGPVPVLGLLPEKRHSKPSLRSYPDISWPRLRPVGPRLLESNVRSFLQARGGGNRGIRDTIAKKPEMFLAYNNGLSATADSVDIEETSKGLIAQQG